MAYNCDILLGKITKVSGYEGAVAVKLEKTFIENIPQLESVFLEIEGRPVPFFIASFEYSGADILRLSFDGYHSDREISEFVGCSIYLTTATGKENIREKNPDFMGYKIIDQEDSPIGSITGIIPNSGQWLINVATEAGKNILIPFHEDFILKIDKRSKTIFLQIPEGLTDLN